MHRLYIGGIEPPQVGYYLFFFGGSVNTVLPYRFCLAITLYVTLFEYLFMSTHNLTTFIPSTYTLLHRVPFQ